LKSQLPPRERRGVVLIDPPFEATDEFDAIVRGLHAALRRFATGTYLIWYPIKISSSLADFRRALAATSPAKAFVAELLVRSERSGDKLSGCGLVAVNPPHTLLGQLQVLLPFLAQRLGQDAHSTYRIGGLIAEPLPH
jgi:23S rRNA (adenine2030-N6)-methyltransferase